MERSKFTEDQITGILKEQEAGVPIADLCRKHGVGNASVYKWKAKYLPKKLIVLAMPQQFVGLRLNLVSPLDHNCRTSTNRSCSARLRTDNRRLPL
jgi:transposase-like protein